MTTEEKIDVLNIVCIETDVDIQELTKRCRKQRTVDARRIAMRILRELFSCSLTEIGAIFQQDHTTVIHALKTHSDICDAYPAEMESYLKIRAIVCEQIHVMPEAEAKTLFTVQDIITYSLHIMERMKTEAGERGLAFSHQLKLDADNVKMNAEYLLSRFSNIKKPKSQLKKVA